MSCSLLSRIISSEGLTHTLKSSKPSVCSYTGLVASVVTYLGTDSSRLQAQTSRTGSRCAPTVAAKMAAVCTHLLSIPQQAAHLFVLVIQQQQQEQGAPISGLFRNRQSLYNWLEKAGDAWVQSVCYGILARTVQEYRD
jgi:hypothetical protein